MENGKLNIFISANNTECGKTYTTLKLIQKFSQMGYKVGVMKPIETGVKDLPVDGKKLFNEAKKYNPLLNKLTLDDIVPIQLKLPAAPIVAGDVDLKKIKTSYTKIKSLCDILLIEGAGGLRVPVKMKNGKCKMENEEWRVENNTSSKFQVPSSDCQVIEMWELAQFFNAKLFMVFRSNLGMINDFLLNKYFLENKNIKYNWAINLFDKSYFEISHPFMKNFNPLFIQKDLDKIAKKLLGE